MDTVVEQDMEIVFDKQYLVWPVQKMDSVVEDIDLRFVIIVEVRLGVFLEKIEQIHHH